jgi:hypothetical protein
LASSFYTLQLRYKKDNKMTKPIKFITLIAVVTVLLSTCSPQSAVTSIPGNPQENNPYAPQTSDETMMRGDTEIASASVLMAESFPPQISVGLAYRLTTPCYQLRVSISQPDSQNRVQLEIYGVAPKNTPCNLMALLTPQEATVNLGSFPAGHYTVWINGVQVGEFDA